LSLFSIAVDFSQRAICAETMALATFLSSFDKHIENVAKAILYAILMSVG